MRHHYVSDAELIADLARRGGIADLDPETLGRTVRSNDRFEHYATERPSLRCFRAEQARDCAANHNWSSDGLRAYHRG